MTNGYKTMPLDEAERLANRAAVEVLGTMRDGYADAMALLEDAVPADARSIGVTQAHARRDRLGAAFLEWITRHAVVEATSDTAHQVRPSRGQRYEILVDPAWHAVEETHVDLPAHEAIAEEDASLEADELTDEEDLDDDEEAIGRPLQRYVDMDD